MFHFQTAAAACLLAAATAFAQLNGRVTGTVSDPSGAVVPNATVDLVLDGGDAALLSAKTDSAGVFDFAAVRPGVYTLVVEAAGFVKYSQQQLKVDPARDQTLAPIKLSLATAATEVEVVSTTQGVDTTTAEIAGTVTASQVQNLPVLDRQINNLFVLEAGVAQNGRANTVINGMRPTYTNLTLDGINIQDSVRLNDLDYIPNKITISQVNEFTVSTSNAAPSTGGSASTIALVTPSGTNDLHGSAYWFNRNSDFAANDWFNNQNRIPRPGLNLNQLGGTAGGPVIHDKLFFYGAYEAFRQKEGTPVTGTILTPTARQGILQYKSGGAIRQFNVLTASGLAPSQYMANLLSQVPASGNNSAIGDGLNTTGYSFNARGNDTRDNVSGKLDYNQSARHVFAASFAWNRDILDRPDITPFYSYVPPVYNDDNAKLLSISHRWTPAATLTNELRGGFNLQPATFVNRNFLPAYSINSSVSSGVGMMFSSPVETSEIGEGRETKYYRLEDNAHWVRGRHSVAFGFQYFHSRAEAANLNGTVPTYTIGLSTAQAANYGFNTGLIPGASSTDVTRANALLATLGGLLTSGSQLFNPTSRTSGFVPGAPQITNFRYDNYAFYALDNFKLRPTLTLTVGLRWDYFPPVDESNGLIIEPQLINNNPVNTLLGNASLDFMGNAVGRPLYKRDLNNFAPNVSLAWDVFGDGKTSLRSGFNIAFLSDNPLNDVVNSVSIVNSGLNTNRGISNLTSRADAPTPIPVPPFGIPTTTAAQYALSPTNPPVEGIMDPNLATPYAEQWNLSIQREIRSGWVVEGRYIGNHVVKILRQIDFNQINVNTGGFLQDFIRARNNGFLAQAAGLAFNGAYNPSVPGSQPLPVISQFPGGGFLNNSTVVAYLRSGEAGTLAQTYQTNGLAPAGFSFFPNPLLLYSSMLTNLSNSSYQGAQFEIRKRTRSGMQFQANYTFSKALTDSFLQRGLEAQLDNNNPRIERAPANFDQRHAFKLNHYVPLPLGGNHRLRSSNPAVKQLIDGWGLSGFLALYSGNPVAIYSARGTLNRGARSAYNTVDTPDTHGQLSNLTGVFMTGDGPYWFNPANIGPNTQGVAPDGSAPFSGQVFFNPQPGGLGSLQRRVLNGPWYRNYNFAVSKIFKIYERNTLELHAEFYNVFNHPNFFINDQNVNSNGFGRFTQQFYSEDGVGPRVTQFGLYYRF